jgi:predicted dehydrogenase
MYVLGKNWSDKYLDYHMNSGEVRIDVKIWFNLEKIEDQYFIRSPDWRLLINYLRQIGPKFVLNKILSRIRESERNIKYLSVGFGIICDAEAKDTFNIDETVVFLAYNHPLCLDKVTIDKRFVIPWPNSSFINRNDSILYYKKDRIKCPNELRTYAGWSPHSGIAIETKLLQLHLPKLAANLQEIVERCVPQACELKIDQNRPIRDRIERSLKYKNGSINCGLFGLGNYAKAMIIPNLDKSLTIAALHEIDPIQLGAYSTWNKTIDTSGYPRSDENYDVYFIAGYHHTHTSIALHALKQGAYAVIEKPIATTRKQIDSLKKAFNAENPNFFACFHKRYSRFNNWAKEDLNVSQGEPVSYHCIVFEVPLPKRHWYHWPNAGSRIISNGCHWIDHFMYFNEYAEVKYYQVQEAKNGDVSVWVELENTAVFSMILTDTGSSRLGLRDYIELKAKGITIRMVDSGRYISENRTRILRRKKDNPLNSYRRMYKYISQQISANKSGDSYQSLRSSELVLTLEQELLNKRTKNRNDAY